MLSRYTPARAFSSAASFKSVARILTATDSARPSSASSRQMASEYTSSPVAHPATQMRIGAPAGRAFSSAGNTFSFTASNASPSRKNCVTRMRKSWNRFWTSPASARSSVRYSAGPWRLRSAIRRRMRRRTVVCL